MEGGREGERARQRENKIQKFPPSRSLSLPFSPPLPLPHSPSHPLTFLKLLTKIITS